jgi:hypothetical protein
MKRVVEPEWLDELPAQEPRAIHSRADLRRLNWFMNHARVLARALQPAGKPRRVMDLGCGDGSFALRLAVAAQWRECEVVLVDRQPVIAPEVRAGFAKRGCSLIVTQCDVLRGLDQTGESEVLFANLFLHHFKGAELARLLANISARATLFAACEPRRASLALFASRLVALIGCNAVTRHDAPASVRAGFSGHELSRLWPTADGWRLDESAKGLFSHLFVATRR